MTDLFKKKILHRAKYRGIKELDIIFDRFSNMFFIILKEAKRLVWVGTHFPYLRFLHAPALLNF